MLGVGLSHAAVDVVSQTRLIDMFTVISSTVRHAVLHTTEE